MNAERQIAYHYPASTSTVNWLLKQPVGSDGISGWTWMRLVNGDLILGVFPRGDTYEACEASITADYEAAALKGHVTQLNEDNG